MAASAVTVLAAAIVFSYLVDRVGASIAPLPILLASLAAGSALFTWSRRGASIDRDGWREVASLAGVVSIVGVAVLWLAWPELLPVGGGSDLTHHLQLIDFLDRHHRLAHSAADAALVGNMINYTPGSHLLAALAGMLTRTDGLHAIHGVLALCVGLKAGLVFLVVRRTLARSVSIAVGLTSVVLLFLPYDYFVGSFARFSFFAQVVAETFAVAMWLALVIWNDRPSTSAAGLFGLAGVATFLTWPVWIGPPVVALIGIAVLARDGSRMPRLASAAWALGPIAIAAVLHASGRAESVAIVQSGGAAVSPTVAAFSWPFLILAGLGLAIALPRSRWRATILLIAATIAQTAALLVVARMSGADSPYMALKMPHFAIYPLAAVAAAALAALYQGLSSALPAMRRATWAPACAWLLLALGAAWVGARFTAQPRPVPAITESVFRAGQWARQHVAADCIEYLVAQDSTSYWLHLAVLGNPSQPPAGARMPVYFYRDALVRWITGASYPVAIADLSLVPREVREDLDVLARFGHVVVGQRRGSAPCAAR